MIVALELGDLRPPGGRPGHSHGRASGLRAGVGEAQPLKIRHVILESPGVVERQAGRHHRVGQLGDLLLDRGNDIGMRVPDQQGTCTHEQIDIAATVDVCHMRAKGRLHKDRMGRHYLGLTGHPVREDIESLRPSAARCGRSASVILLHAGGRLVLHDSYRH